MSKLSVDNILTAVAVFYGRMKALGEGKDVLEAKAELLKVVDSEIKALMRNPEHEVYDMLSESAMEASVRAIKFHAHNDALSEVRASITKLFDGKPL